MELALNLVWSVLAAISLLLWGVYALSFPQKRRCFTAIVALICVIAFLFPVISMSDDLQSGPAVCETNKLKKWVSADLAEALLLSAGTPPAFPEANARRGVNLHAEIYLPSRELVWFNLDRRPPPQRS